MEIKIPEDGMKPDWGGFFLGGGGGIGKILLL